MLERLFIESRQDADKSGSPSEVSVAIGEPNGLHDLPLLTKISHRVIEVSKYLNS